MPPRDLEQLLSRITRWGIFILPVLPLFVSTSMLFPFITGRNFAFRVIIEILAAAWVGLLCLSREFRPRLTPLTRALIAFIFVVTLADLLGVNPYRSFWSNYERMEGLLALLHMALFFFIAGSVFRKIDHWRNLLYTSSAVSVLVSFTALLQKLGISQAYQGGVRVDGTIGNPTYLASYLMFHAFFLAYLMIREPKVWLRWVSGAVIAFELSIIYLTASRGVTLAMAVVVGAIAVFFAWREGEGKLGRRVRIVAIAALALGALLTGAFFAARNSSYVRESPVLSRFANLSFRERTVQSRTMIWGIAWQGFKERPVLGWGQENFYLPYSKYFDPRLWNSEPWFDRSHNFIFDWLIHAGVPGLAGYLAVVFLGARNLWLAARRGWLTVYEGAILLGLVGAYLIQNLTVFDNFQSYFLLFLLLAMSDWLIRSGSGKEAAGAKHGFGRTEHAWTGIAAAGVVAVFLLYFLNLKPILASQTIIRGLTASRSAPVKEVQKNFEEAFTFKTFGTGEGVEQMASLVRGYTSGSVRVPKEDLLSFVNLTVRELGKFTATSGVDPKHLLFLGSVYNSATALNPEFAKASIDALLRAAKLSPAKQQVYFELAAGYLGAGDPPKAVEAMQKSVDLDPSFHGAHLNLAIAAIMARQNDLAEREIGEYRRLIPRVSAGDLGRVIQAYAQVNDIKNAKRYIDEAILLEPDNAGLYGQRAAVLALLGDKIGAKAAAQKAAALDPKLKSQSEEFIKELEAGN